MKRLTGIDHKYVVGFVFNSTRDKVLLQEKKRPSWQKGLLNGPGGKINPNEWPIDAMRREWNEESIYSPQTPFEKFAILNGKDSDNKSFQVHFFRAFGFYTISHRKEDLHDEVINIYDVNNLPDNLVPNLRYLIPMAAIAGLDDRSRRFNIFENYD